MPVCAKDLRCVQAHPFRPRLLATSTETRCRQAAPSSPWCTTSPPTGEHAQMVTDQTKCLLVLGSQMLEPVADRRTGRPQGDERRRHLSQPAHPPPPSPPGAPLTG